MKKLLQIVLFLWLLWLPIHAFAMNSNIENAYQQLLDKLDLKYPLEVQQDILKDLSGRIEVFSENNNNSWLTPLLDDLQSLNNEKLYELWLGFELKVGTQKVQELREIAAFKATLANRTHPSHINNLISSKIRYINTNTGREFLDGNDIKRVLYSSYIPITASNASRLEQNTGIIVFDDSDGYRFIENYDFETKTPYSQLIDLFDIFLTENHRVSEKNGSYFAYNFINFRFFEDKYWVYPSSLETSWFDFKTTILYKRSDGGYNFVTDYDEYKISQSDILFGVPEKHLLLDNLREDAKFETSDISAQLTRLKDLSNELTRWKNREQSIQSIYAWILNNIEYSSVIDLNDEKIFSWIETFKNRQWVCTWYTKLTSYLFYFAGYNDVEVIRWHVIDAQDFPQIWHAWLKIGDLYYDPTFDDPVGAQTTRDESEYKYFWLPKDIFYANRYEYWDLPEFLNTASKKEINTHIFNKLTDLVPKYESSMQDFPVFWEVNFRNNNNISINTTITPDLLAQTIWSFTVNNNSFSFSDATGTTKRISWFNYYPLRNDNISSVLNILSYDTDDLTLFNWQTESGEYEWRLAYNLQLR